MNAVSKILRIVAILGAVAAGVFFFLTQGKIQDLTSQLDSTKNSLTSQLNAAKADAAAATDKATKAEEDAKTLATQLQDAKSEAAGDADLLNQAKQEIDTAQKQIAPKDRAIADLTKKVDDLTKNTVDVTSMTREVMTLRDLNAKLSAQVADMEKNPPKPQINPTAVAAGPSKLVTILSVDTKNGLILLDAGSDKGIADKSTIQLQKDKVVLGAVMVSESHPGYSVATITSTGNMSEKDFYNLVKKGLVVDAVQLD